MTSVGTGVMSQEEEISSSFVRAYNDWWWDLRRLFFKAR